MPCTCSLACRVSEATPKQPHILQTFTLPPGLCSLHLSPNPILGVLATRAPPPGSHPDVLSGLVSPPPGSLFPFRGSLSPLSSFSLSLCLCLFVSHFPILASFYLLLSVWVSLLCLLSHHCLCRCLSLIAWAWAPLSSSPLSFSAWSSWCPCEHLCPLPASLCVSLTVCGSVGPIPHCPPSLPSFPHPRGLRR